MKTISDVKCFLLDMDGTFYLGDRLIDGSLEFIEAVVNSGRDYLFLTNNSSHNAAHYVKKLAKMGLSVPRDKVLTSGQATAVKVNELFPGKRAFRGGKSERLEGLRGAAFSIKGKAEGCHHRMKIQPYAGGS